jgi:hypothetical protein
MVRKAGRAVRPARAAVFATAALIVVAACGSGASTPAANARATAAATVPLASPTEASRPSPSAAAAQDGAGRIALGGAGPIGIDVARGHAWVILTDSGGLVEVDLATDQVIRTIDIPAGGSQVVATADGTIYVGRYAADSTGQTIAVADVSSGQVTGIAIAPIGGLAVEGSSLWALQTSGRVTRIDRTSLRSTGSVSVHVDTDAHMDAIAGAGSVWVSGDRTPVRRITGSKPSVAAEIETGGGIPLPSKADWCGALAPTRCGRSIRNRTGSLAGFHSTT